MSLDSNALLKSAGIGAGAMFVLALLAQVPLVGLVCCCLIFLGYAGVGAGYGYFVKQNEGEINPGSFALGGAIAAAIAGIVQGVISGIAALIIGTGSTAASLAQLEAQGIDIPPEMYDLYAGAGAGAVGALTSICCAFIIAAVLGAIGGAIYGAVVKDKDVPEAPAV